jgi:hypothetical protein
MGNPQPSPFNYGEGSETRREWGISMWDILRYSPSSWETGHVDKAELTV